MDYDLHFRQWIGCGGDSDHHPVYFQILNSDIKARSPFNFNAFRLHNDDPVTLLKASWIVYDDSSEVSPASNFDVNLKSLKHVSSYLSVKKKAQEIKDLVDIEFSMIETLHKMGFGFTSEDDKSSLVELETWKRKFLCDQEMDARQKSKVL